MIKKISQLFLILVLFTACNSNPLDVDVSNQDVSIEFHRLDLALFNAKDEKELKILNDKFYNSIGELYDFYTIEMLGIGTPKNDSIGVYFNNIVQEPMMKLLNDSVQVTFGDFKEEETQIIDMFKHLKYHIPTASIPKGVVTYISSFNSGVVSAPTHVGISLEMYLGRDSKIIKEGGFYEYMKPKMDKEFLMPDIAENWLLHNVVLEDRGDDVISSMIYYGKLMYIIDAMLPQLKPYQKIRYTQAQYDWAVESELAIWQHMIAEKVLYSTNLSMLARYFNEGPSTSGYDGSPSRIGQYFGWQIVKAYMEKNTDVTVLELLSEKNQTKILNAYKPNK